ncbi:hypothetical protein KJ562_01515 [Patescibacteria group bacterium]|nr:hypothetical protein [Patescibacteria group bacterium]MBU4162439.1 hypothetical protein [Patescibacteria group bacterium]
MKKKIYDITPPQKQPQRFIPGKVIPIKEEKIGVEPNGNIAIPEIKVSEIKRKGISPGENFQKAKKFSAWKIAILVICIVIAVGGYWTISSTNKITIELVPATELFSLETSIALTASTSEFMLASELSQTIIPVELIEIEKEFNKEFSAGQAIVEEKARGTIRVYNKHMRDISLVENTRFLSSSEPTRQFHAETKIVVPMGGYADIPVIASEAGGEYNIEPCTFSVPGLRNFSPPQLYYDIYGKSFSDMQGGRKETILKVTKESLENAQKELLAVAKQEMESVLQKEAGDDYKILGDSIEIELINGSPLNVQEGQEIDKFVYHINVKAKAFMAKKADLLEFGRAYLGVNMSSNKEFIDESIDIAFLSESGGILTGLKAKLKVSAQIYSIIDEESLREIVKGRSRSDIARYTIGICPELAKQPKVTFSPFWARKASLSADQIKISVIFK